MTQVIAMLGLVGITVLGAPTIAAAADATLCDRSLGECRATLYELTENMRLVLKHQQHHPVNSRLATSALTGTAKLGTPLCPKRNWLSGADSCAVNVLGSDNVSLTTGLGTLSGEFTTVIQEDNPVDGPEAMVLKGNFDGFMDFSPAILNRIPYGTVVGKVGSEHGRATEFTGIFRLPFVGNVETEVEVQPGVKVKGTLRQFLCPGSPNPNPYAQIYVKLYPYLYGSFRDVGGVDLTYVDNVELGTCLNIGPEELSLGVPMVRFDIEF